MTEYLLLNCQKTLGNFRRTHANDRNYSDNKTSCTVIRVQ